MPPSAAPLVPLALGLTAGLITARAAATPALLATPCAAALLVAWPTARPALLGLLLGLLLGGPVPRPPHHVAALRLPAVHLLEGRVEAAPPPGSRGQRVLLACDVMDDLPRPPFLVQLAFDDESAPVVLRPGDRIRTPARLTKPPRARNPGAVDRRRRLARRRIHLTGWVERPGALVRLSPGEGLGAGIVSTRWQAAATLDRRLGPRNGGLARALLLGDRGSLDPRDRALFADVGQGHLIAVSGLHVGLLLGGLLWLLRRAGLGARATAVAGLVAVALYVPFAGAPPSAVRAGAGAGLHFLGRLLGRHGTAAGLLAAVAVAVLLLEPWRFDDPSLTLSFAAVSGILLLTPTIHEMLVPPRPVVRGLLDAPSTPVRSALAVSLGAWLGVVPLLASVMGRVCPVAALLSVLTVPLAALLVASGALLLLAGFAPPFGVMATGTFATVADVLRVLLAGSAQLGWGARPVASPSPLWILAWGVALLVLSRGCRAQRPRGVAALLVLLVLLFLRSSREPLDDPRLVLLDVGHGQAAVLLFPDGRSVLADAGRIGDPEVGRRVVLPALESMGVAYLDVVAVSHPDADHVGGVPDVLRQMEVGELVVPPAPASGFSRLVWPATRTRRAVAGDLLLEGAWGRLVVLAPDGAGGPALDENDASLVLSLEAHQRCRLLLPGDIEREGVARLLEHVPGLCTDVLLLPHHGRPGGGRDRLLAQVRPQVTLASTGASIVPHLPAGTFSTAVHGALLVDLKAGGVVVHTPWAHADDEYDAPLVPTPLPVSAPVSLAIALVALTLLVFAVLSVRPLRWLTAPAAVAAGLLGVAAFAAWGGAGLAALFAPFVGANLLGRLPGASRSPARTLRQVLANGLPAGLGCLAALLGAPAIGGAAFLGALACLGADTCATEIGVRYGGTPRSLVGARRLAPGESGGVTVAGLLASVGGAFLAPAAAWVLADVDAAAVGLIALAGVVAGLADSLLGATLQYRGREKDTGRVVEDRTTEKGATERVSGLRWLDNDGVNLVAGLVGAGLAIGLLGARLLP